jgi:hypothetical protein
MRVGYEREGRRADAANVVVYDRQMQCVKVWHVARYIEGRNLVALGHDLLTSEEAGHYDGASNRRVSLTQHVFTVAQRLNRMGHRRKLGLIFPRNADNGQQTGDQLSMGHVPLSLFRPTNRLAAADANGQGRRCAYQRTQAKLFKLKNIRLARAMLCGSHSEFPD